ncbi:hypothetical protein LC087_18495 [Bacillus carboniphilus]|uniref:Uncharacterized protein n=1 Tax=Bacillus carboniphilus TaxID=86663 RepID=A0ABY9JTD6_9BACI|nr:hypothetical protein [Bacillus carboniphilus]WLR42640.1 hypothetical protein LC087_18495 [Bacillus carboniphilus]
MPILDLVTFIIPWSIIAIIAYYFYKKQEMKPNIILVIIVIYVGVFTFSIKLDIFDHIGLPILPLGVWFLYLVLNRKEGRWERYRKFAWLGFAGSYLIFATMLAANPFYPSSDPEVDPLDYLFHVKDATVIQTHPSAEKCIFNKEVFLKEVTRLTEGNYDPLIWLNESVEREESNQKNERFPYILMPNALEEDASVIIHIEEDGKGLLVTTTQQTHYFQIEKSILKEGIEDEK